MSLSRILNDDPIPVRSAYTSPPNSAPLRPPYVLDTSPRAPRGRSSPPHDHPDTRTQSFHPMAENDPEEDAYHIKSQDEHDLLSPSHSEDTVWRKRRKSMYAYEGGPQNTYRIYPSRLRAASPRSPGSNLLAQGALKTRNGATDEELRLTSSDLEDCEEVWIGELSDYMLETQKRQNQVADWFESSIVVSRS